MKLLTSRAARSPYAHLPFFVGWSDAELTRMSRLIEVIDYEPGDILAAGGQRAREFIVIVCGKVDVVEGRRRLATLGEGDTIGEEGMLTDALMSSAAVAQTYVKALVLGPRQFHGLLYDAPSMGRRLSMMLAARLAARPATSTS
ncbi:MAG: cyclic nucleotide-binding domain-containing protein [Actinomycetota bacterium]|nr:cyclic nucleotide-binding domain-containing protein [Actinomycetota bacterium]